MDQPGDVTSGWGTSSSSANPDASHKDSGFATGERPAEKTLNWLFQAVGAWQDWLTSVFDYMGLSAKEQRSFFGDGSDGSAVVTTSVTMTRDMYYQSLTLGAGGSIDTAGNRLFVSSTLFLSSASGANAIHCNGAAGGNVTGHVQAGASGGATVTNKLVAGRIGGAAGGNGGSNPAGVGSNGGSIAWSTGVVAGGVGGAGAAGAKPVGGGNGGSAGASSSTAEPGAPSFFPQLFGDGAAAIYGGLGGAGGGGGGGQVASFGDGGAGGGAGGGVLFVACHLLSVGSGTPAGVLAANGGIGGTTDTVGYQGAGGGGGGGGGGVVVLLVGEKTGAGKGTIANGIKADGGNGNTGFTGGTLQAGFGGNGGRIFYHEIYTPDYVSVAGGSGSGQTGGTCRATL